MEKHPLEASRDVRTLKGQPKVRNMPKKRLPAIADRAVLEEVTKVRAGIRWDTVVEKVWKDRGGKQQEVMSVLREVCGVQGWSKRMIDTRERLTPTNKVKEEQHLRFLLGVKTERYGTTMMVIPLF